MCGSRVLVRTIFLLALSFPVPSFAASSNTVKTEHITAQLITEHEAVVPGRSTAVALRLQHIPDWHTYWRNPGDSGLPTTIQWTLPRGVHAGEIQWPVPQRIPVGPLMNYGYENEIWLISDIKVPADYTASSVVIEAQVDWLVCADICIPESGHFKLTLPVATKMPLNKGVEQDFVYTRANYPIKQSNENFKAATTENGAALYLPVLRDVDPLHDVYFFSHNEGQIEAAEAQTLRRTEAGYELQLPRAKLPTFPLARLQGVLVVSGAKDHKAIEIDLPVTGAVVETPPVAPANKPALTLVVAVVFAFFGGMILNLMPCVFPVLSIKILGFAHEADPGRARRHGAFYAIGVVLSFWVLAALLMGLRAAGEQVGWGFQLQAPGVVVALAVLFFLLALNLSGLFEIGHILPSSIATAHAKQPDRDAFLSGVLAVAVASPCTAPFMGAALGYAITQPIVVSFAVFTALGLGMALPYVSLAWFPRARRLLPAPGAWMQRLRELLAFPLYATIIWLAWVLGMQRGVDAISYLLLVLLLIALAIWLLRATGEARRRYWTYVVAVLALVFALLAVSRIVVLPPTGEDTSRQTSRWQPYSTKAVAAFNAQGKTVFVDFTAAWCVTCQANKLLVLDTDEIQDAFAARGIELMRADWTKRDPNITRALEALGRSGVPVYLLQRPGKAPNLLPELLTKKIVLQALDDY